LGSFGELVQVHKCVLGAPLISEFIGGDAGVWLRLANGGQRHGWHRFFGALHFAPDKLVESWTVNGLVPEEFGGDLLVLVAVQSQNLFRLGVAAVEEFLYFLVNFTGGLLAAITLELELMPGEERGLALNAVRQADALAHSIEGDHLPGQRGGAFQIVLRAGADFAEDDLLGGTSAEHAADAVEQLAAREQELVFGRQLHGVAKRGAAPGQDADFMHGIGVRTVSRHQRVTDFMIGDAANEVGRVNDDLAVETAGPEKGAVEDFGPVRGGNENDAGVGLETVHFDEQRVECLLAFVVHSANMDAALAPDGVQLVNENDA